MSPWTNAYHLAATGNDILVEQSFLWNKKEIIFDLSRFIVFKSESVLS